MADDWRVTVTFRDEADVQQAVRSVREHEVEDDVRSRLGDRVAMSVDGPAVFLYAGTEDTAREADRVVREVLALRQLTAGTTIDRWHPVAQEWRDASAPMLEDDNALAAERRSRLDTETEQSRSTGLAAWQVRVALPSHREAVELAGRLRAAGRPVIRRWKYLILGAGNEDEAIALAEMIRQAAPALAPIRIEASPSVDTRPLVTGEVAALFFHL